MILYPGKEKCIKDINAKSKEERQEKIMLKIKTKALVVACFLAISTVFTGCSAITSLVGGKDAAEISEEMLAKFNEGAAISYKETYVADGNDGSYTIKRDTEGNMMIIDIGYNQDGAYYYEDYKIDGSYYEKVDGQIVDGVAYDDYTPEGYFEDAVEYIAGMIEFAAVETFQPDVEYTLTEKDKNTYLVTGEYESGGSYTLEIAKDGSTMTYVDDECNLTLKIDVEEKVELPNS